jgi:oligopeptide/dipeptide ABC transporter ATP-binding protein
MARVAEEPLLSVRNLSVGFTDGNRALLAANQVSFDVMAGRTLGLVGESGCGKSITMRALIGLQRPAEVFGGQVLFDGDDLLHLPAPKLVTVRGSRLAMIFQDPMSALNPLMTVGAQVAEVLRVKAHLSRKEAASEAVTLLKRVGIPAAQHRYRDYPHQLSGGMRQRVMIATAIACHPDLLLADEPTTALDVTIQDQILALLQELRAEYGMAMILVSHDLGVVAQSCDTLAVMYAGRIVEYGATRKVLGAPRHPYTEALLNAAPPDHPVPGHPELRTVDGQPPELGAIPVGCPFEPRCLYASSDCGAAPMVLEPAYPCHGTTCIYPDRVQA